MPVAILSKNKEDFHPANLDVFLVWTKHCVQEFEQQKENYIAHLMY